LRDCFGLSVDASQVAVGVAYLRAEDGSEKPIAFASLKLTPTVPLNRLGRVTMEMEAFAVI